MSFLQALLTPPNPAWLGASPLAVPGLQGSTSTDDWIDGNTIFGLAPGADLHALPLDRVSVRVLAPQRDVEHHRAALTARGFRFRYALTAVTRPVFSASRPVASASRPVFSASRPEAETELVRDAPGLDAWFETRVTAGYDAPPVPPALRRRLLDALGERLHLTLSGRPPAAAGGATWFPEASVAYLWGGASTDRGGGAYRAVVAARIAAAAEAGLTTLWTLANPGSGPTMAAFGFTGEERWEQWTWTPPRREG